MRRALLFCAAIVFAIACGDNITEPIPERSKAVSVPVSFATTTTEDGLSISTDKDDYAPGDVVQLTGIGWEAGEVLDIALDDGAETHRWTVTVEADGTFHDATYVVDTEDLGVTFTLTATSRSPTGQSLTVVFTDGNFTFASSPAGLLTSITYDRFNGTLTCSGLPSTPNQIWTPGTNIGLNNNGGGQSIRFTVPSVTGHNFTGYTPGGATISPASSAATTVYCLSGNAPGTPLTTITLNYVPATKLAFTTQPSGGEPNSALPAQPVVEVQDASGNKVATSTASVTLAIVTGTGTAGAALTCTNNPVNAVAGVASFAGCKIDLAGTGYKLRASSPGLTSADSDPFNVTVVNQAPVANDDSYSTNEDTPLSVSEANGVLKNDTDANGDPLTAVLVSGPASGSLTLNSDGSFNFTPAANFNGNVSFTYRANDGHVNSAAPATVTITVNAVNDQPSFTKGADQTVLEDAGAQTVPMWATTISKGPADESGQTLSFEVTNNTNPGLFAAGPAISSSGTLTYTPAANANGEADITIVLKDDGGTANGGDDTSDPETFKISVTPVNDAPSFTKGANQTANEGDGAQTVTGWATSISAGPPDESGQTLTFEVTGNTNPSIFSVAPAIASNGTLTYTPSLGPNGTSTITVRLKDNGGTANGGVDVSATQTFGITVNNVAPAIGTLTDQSNVDLPDPVTVVIAGTLSFKVPFTDPGTADNHIAEVDCGSGYSAVNGGATVTSGFTASCQFSNSIGPKMISVRVTDDHDSDVMTQNVLVVYNFSGFFAPVDRPNMMNVSKAGQAIPLKWRLTDALGRPITDVTSVTVQSVGIPCGAYTGTDVIEEYAAGSSGLQNLGDGNYQFNWKTPAGYGGTCKSIALVFGAGSGYTEKPSAFFTFKK